MDSRQQHSADARGSRESLESGSCKQPDGKDGDYPAIRYQLRARRSTNAVFTFDAHCFPLPTAQRSCLGATESARQVAPLSEGVPVLAWTPQGRLNAELTGSRAFRDTCVYLLQQKDLSLLTTACDRSATIYADGVHGTFFLVIASPVVR